MSTLIKNFESTQHFKSLKINKVSRDEIIAARVKYYKQQQEEGGHYLNLATVKRCVKEILPNARLSSKVYIIVRTLIEKLYIKSFTEAKGVTELNKHKTLTVNDMACIFMSCGVSNVLEKVREISSNKNETDKLFGEVGKFPISQVHRISDSVGITKIAKNAILLANHFIYSKLCNILLRADNTTIGIARESKAHDIELNENDDESETNDKVTSKKICDDDVSDESDESDVSCGLRLYSPVLFPRDKSIH